jgi:hypothetical protein
MVVACKIGFNMNHKGEGKIVPMLNQLLYHVNSSSSLHPTVWLTIADFVAGSVVVRMPKLSFSKRGLNLQNKYLIRVNNNNNNKI